ncbi:MAG: SDR family oxidoreductase [Myxococcota bacterium]
MSRVVFLTGFPGFIGRRVVQKLFAVDDAVEVLCLVEPRQSAQAQRAKNELILEHTRELGIEGRLRIVEGDVTAMDVGLSGPEYRDVTARTTEIYHLAAIRALDAERRRMDAVNVAGTESMLSLGRAMGRLSRFVHFSSAYVSGDRTGVVMEDELEVGQSFRNGYEASKHRAEVLVQNAKNDLPVSVIRPAGVVGDSETGQIDRLDSVYHLGMLLAGSPAALPIPLGGQGRAPLHIAPVDFLVDAVHVITNQSWTLGETFHVVDPNPLPVRRVYETVAQLAGRKMPRYTVPTNLAKALLRIPGMERLSSVSHEAMDYVDHMVFYNSRNTSRALEGSGIACPPFEHYIQNLIQYVRDHVDASSGPGSG